MKKVLLLSSLLLVCAYTFAQQLVTGTVSDNSGAPLIGANVREKGGSSGTVTDAEGAFTLRVSSPEAVLSVTYIGYLSQDVPLSGRSNLSIVLEEGVNLGEVQVVGTRSLNRSATQTPVAIDIIDLREVTSRVGQLDVNQLLQFAAPSFNANKQSGADGADHIDPATLRGLGPDQTLVLVNGKRRHQSSLVNIFGTRGRGNTGTDLNAIPVSAIERIEILRDGASAQYGSDAIAGVINIVLKSTVDEFSGNLNVGAYNATPPADYAVASTDKYDGQMMQLNGNYGARLGEKGFVNVTLDYLTKDHTNRPADPNVFDIYRQQYGDAASDNFSAFANASTSLGGNTSVYAFGGFTHRFTDAYAWTRSADSERNVPAIYPNGFNPRITSIIGDQSYSVGLRSKLRDWDVDFNNTFGQNDFRYTIDGTLNASLLERSPTRFDAGGHRFSQNTTSLAFTRSLPDLLQGANIAFGIEHRVDNYEIFAGEEGSWRNYGIVDTIINGRPVQVDLLGRPAGSQGFPGFQPANELNEYRTNLGAYADAEFDLTDRFMVAAAVRFENYSDFGATLNGKLAARLAVTDAVALRASVSSGFRAPSLAQIYYNSTFTDFVSGVPTEKIIARNNSPITRALGIPALQEEKALNASLGLTARFGDFTATIDGYYVDIQDRIVLTGAFEDTDPDIGQELQRLNVAAAQFFTNALDTRTSGLDVVLSWAKAFNDNRLRLSFAGNFNRMELGDINTSAKLQGKEDIYFGSREQLFLLASAPESKLNLTMDYRRGKFNANLRFVRFGEVTLEDFLGTLDVYEARITTDLTLGLDLSSRMSLNVGAANLFNVYPTQQDTETETGGLWDAVQMGFGGSFYFAKLNFRF